MVTVDSTASPVRPKRRGQGARKRQKRRGRIRGRSARLVKSGRVELTPCVACGSTQNLTIHHVEPIQPGRFVFLCEECHVLAHKPIFRTMQVCIASGHFSIRPEAIAGRTDRPALRPGRPPSVEPIRAAPIHLGISKRPVPLNQGDHRALPPNPQRQRPGHSAPQLEEPTRKAVPHA